MALQPPEVKDAFQQFAPDGFATIVMDLHGTGGKLPESQVWKGIPVVEQQRVQLRWHRADGRYPGARSGDINSMNSVRAILGGGKSPSPLNGALPSHRPHGLMGPPRGTLVADAGQTRTKPKPKATTKTTGREVTVVGSFSNPYGGVAKEVKAMKENRWEPTTDDFTDVAGTSVTVDSYLGILYVILAEGDREAPEGSISRLNIFTHANSDLIALSGRVTVGDMTTSVSLRVSSAISEETLENLNKGVTFQVPSKSKALAAKKFTLDDVRKRFTKDAVIVIYACHSGLSGSFMQDIADTFQVKVRGFTDVVGYFPTFDEDPPKVKTRRQVGIGHNSPNKSTDFHNLDAKAVEKLPKVPKPAGSAHSDDDE